MNARGEKKYEEAVRLYAESDLSVSEIARQLGIGRSAFAMYIQRCHRDLMYKRHSVTVEDREKRLRGRSGQGVATKEKYRDAIEAADSKKYIGMNISEIARAFGVSPAGLANQLRVHYPEIVERRERMREQMGLADDHHRGSTVARKAIYDDALKLLETTDLTIKEVAERSGVSFTGLRQHLQSYHKKLMEARRERLHR